MTRSKRSSCSDTREAVDIRCYMQAEHAMPIITYNNQYI